MRSVVLIPRLLPALTILGFSLPVHATTVRETAEKILGQLGAIQSAQEPLCSDCHALNTRVISDWGDQAQSIKYDCFQGAFEDNFDQWTREKALEAVACLRDPERNNEFTPHRLGLYAAGMHLENYRKLFELAYDDYQPEYNAFLNAVKMPPGNRQGFSPADFTAMRKWNDGYPNRPFLEEIIGNITFPDQCQSWISPKLPLHLDAMQTEGWRARNRANGIMMFGCPDDDSLHCFTQHDSTGRPVFPRSADTVYGSDWAQDTPDSAIRVIYQIPQKTSFWMRTSADGRFVANGLSGGPNSPGDGFEGMITDLSGLTGPSRQAKDIPVLAYFDPAFFPDNSGFMFQGNRTGICSQRTLENPAVTRIDWTQPGCSASDEHQVGLYQSIGTSLGGSDLLAVTGPFASDFGGMPDGNAPFNSVSRAWFQMLAFDGTIYRNVARVTKEMPFEGDFAFSPSAKILSSRMTGADDNYNQIPLAYKFYGVSFTPGPVSAVETEELATFCQSGRKGNFSFDERFWTFHRIVEPGDWRDLGFANASDPEFTALVGQSSNIHVIDLLTGTSHRLTRMRSGQYAQFPHFRSDNWLMFMVEEGQTRYVVGSDAVIRKEKR
jgi:hypothetical protein